MSWASRPFQGLLISPRADVGLTKDRRKIQGAKQISFVTPEPLGHQQAGEEKHEKRGARVTLEGRRCSEDGAKRVGPPVDLCAKVIAINFPRGPGPVRRSEGDGRGSKATPLSCLRSSGGKEANDFEARGGHLQVQTIAPHGPRGNQRVNFCRREMAPKPPKGVSAGANGLQIDLGNKRLLSGGEQALVEGYDASLRIKKGNSSSEERTPGR